MKSQWLIVLFVLGSSLISVLAYPQMVITQIPSPKVTPPVLVTKWENATSPSATVAQSIIEQDLKRVAMIGILFGAVQGEAEMEKKLNRQLQDLSRTFGVTRFDVKTRKVAALERSMERDKVAIGILTGALDLASQSMTYEQYRREMRKLSEVWQLYGKHGRAFFECWNPIGVGTDG